MQAFVCLIVGGLTAVTALAAPQASIVIDAASGAVLAAAAPTAAWRPASLTKLMTLNWPRGT
jgi:D-alanyl-D-alanine carboxypeptidase